MRHRVGLERLLVPVALVVSACLPIVTWPAAVDAGWRMAAVAFPECTGVPLAFSGETTLAAIGLEDSAAVPRRAAPG